MFMTSFMIWFNFHALGTLWLHCWWGCKVCEKRRSRVRHFATGTEAGARVYFLLPLQSDSHRRRYTGQMDKRLQGFWDGERHSLQNSYVSVWVLRIWLYAEAGVRRVLIGCIQRWTLKHRIVYRLSCQNWAASHATLWAMGCFNPKFDKFRSSTFHTDVLSLRAFHPCSWM